MTPIIELFDLVARMAATHLDGRRRLSATDERRFTITMHNDYLTPRGRPYKWSTVMATVDRAVTGGQQSTMVPVTYTWRSVRVHTGTPKDAGKPREWGFARGQRFDSALLHCVVDGAAGEATVEGAAGLTLDVAYPDLPKSPAVDMLLMLTWDVITMEMMCTHMATTPELRVPGRPTEVKRVSGSWANLRFASPETSGSFHNTDMTATAIGFGLRGGRPVAAYTFQCLDCPLAVRAGRVEQTGRSSYWGTIQVDLATGDLVTAEMTEMIVATLSGTHGERVPVQKRRIVRMEAETDGPTVSSDNQDPAVLADAIDHTNDVANYLRWQMSALRNQSDGIAPLASMGFRSLVGVDIPEALDHVREMRADLRAWAEGDGKARAKFRESLLSHRQLLEGLLGFGQITVDQAARVWPDDAAGHRALQARMQVTERCITELLAILKRFED